MINELIEQIGGRKRLEKIVEFGKVPEYALMARALLAVLDAKPVGWVDSEEMRSIDKNRHATIYKIEPDNPYHDPRRQKLVYLAPPAASVNYPAIPEGWIPMPRKLTAENGAKAALSGDFTEHKFINCSECFGDDECESCDGSGLIKVEVTVSWSTIKAIWEKGADHFAAAPAPGGDAE